MPSAERWLLIHTSTPLRINIWAMSAWMSEKPIARSGRSARIRSTFALVNADTRGFSRRTDREAGDADDAMLLTERVEHLGGFFGQADDALWEHQPSIAAPADARHRLRPARARSPASPSD